MDGLRGLGLSIAPWRARVFGTTGPSRRGGMARSTAGFLMNTRTTMTGSAESRMGWDDAIASASQGKVRVEVGGSEMTLERFVWAKRADGGVIARMGNTTVLATCVWNERICEEGFGVPLTVDYEEFTFANNTIRSPLRPPSEHRDRTGSNSDGTILASRLIDRALRPLFPKGFSHPVQIICKPLSYDGNHDPFVLAINAAACALGLSSIPWETQLGAVRLGFSQAETLVVNPPFRMRKGSSPFDSDFFISGTGGDRVVMLEYGGRELNNDAFLHALRLGCDAVDTIVKAQREFIELNRTTHSSTRVHFKHVNLALTSQDIQNAAWELTYDLALDSIQAKPQVTKNERKISQTDFWSRATDVMNRRFGMDDETKLVPSMYDAVHTVFEHALRDVALGRRRIANRWCEHVPCGWTQKRPDGRGLDELRPIECEVDMFPVPHGSALFSRGETQVLSRATLTTEPLINQIRDRPLSSLHELKSNFMGFYDFPPYCVNRVEPIRTNRRMYGHGALSTKALLGAFPNELKNESASFVNQLKSFWREESSAKSLDLVEDYQSALRRYNGKCSQSTGKGEIDMVEVLREVYDVYNYGVRLSSEATGSDGSTSMATVCAGSLALMDAGYPLAKHVAGISIGLYADEEDDSSFATLVDILGMEDHFGDMDFKVAGTVHGVTAAQLDIKRKYVTIEMISDALDKAAKARAALIDTMNRTLPEPRKNWARKRTIPRSSRPFRWRPDSSMQRQYVVPILNELQNVMDCQILWEGLRDGTMIFLVVGNDEQVRLETKARILNILDFAGNLSGANDLYIENENSRWKRRETGNRVGREHRKRSRKKQK